MRYHNLVMKAIDEDYHPTLEDGEPDPSVIFVGPFMDGLGQFCPELFREDDQRTPRTKVKRFARDLVNPNTGRREGAGALFGRLVFTRPPHEPIVFTSGFLINEEPGEVTNSVELLRTPDGLQMVHPITKDATRPQIRIIKAADLHYLKEGDVLEFTWRTQRGQNGSLRYILKPIVEGSSLINEDSSERDFQVL